MADGQSCQQAFAGVLAMVFRFSIFPNFLVLVVVAHRAGRDQVWLSSMISMAELYLPQPLFYTKAKTALVLLVSIYLHILLTQTNLYFTWFGHKPI